MKAVSSFFALAGLLLAAGCTDVALFAANIPTHFNGIDIHKNISIGPSSYEKLDIYTPPATNPAEKRTVIVFFYGGRWESGSKDAYRFVGSALAKQGFVVVIPDYRKYPQVKFPAFIEDAAHALAWTSDHIAEYGGDPDKINVAGHSSGAHIAALAVTDPRYLAAYGKKRAIIRKFAGLAGPYDFVPDENDLKDMFGPPSNYRNMQVTTFVDGHQPPMLLMWGDGDKLVGRSNLDKLATAIHKKGGYVETKIYPDVGHIWILGMLSWVGPDAPPPLTDMTRFFKEPAAAE